MQWPIPRAYLLEHIQPRVPRWRSVAHFWAASKQAATIPSPSISSLSLLSAHSLSWHLSLSGFRSLTRVPLEYPTVDVSRAKRTCARGLKDPKKCGGQYRGPDSIAGLIPPSAPPVTYPRASASPKCPQNQPLGHVARALEIAETPPHGVEAQGLPHDIGVLTAHVWGKP